MIDIKHDNTYKIGDEYFHIYDFELLEDRNAYMIRCTAALANRETQFRFAGSRYYIVSYSELMRAEKLMRNEFRGVVRIAAHNILKVTTKKEQLFRLTELESSARDAYIHYFGEDSFNEMIEGLRNADKQ